MLLVLVTILERTPHFRLAQDPLPPHPCSKQKPAYHLTPVWKVFQIPSVCSGFGDCLVSDVGTTNRKGRNLTVTQ